MKKIYLSRNLKDELSFSKKESEELIVLAFASIYGEVKWMFLNSGKETFTSVLTCPVLGFVTVKDTLNMCATTSENRVNVDVGGDEIYISEVKVDAPEHVKLTVTFDPMHGREYDEVFSYPEEN
jgi:hypothetical protein